MNDTCLTVTAMYDYWFQNLPEEMIAETETHIAGCAECQMRRNRYEEIHPERIEPEHASSWVNDEPDFGLDDEFLLNDEHVNQMLILFKRK